MGVTAPKKILNSVLYCSEGDLYIVARGIRDMNDPDRSRRPRIAVDASVLAHKYRHLGVQKSAAIIDFCAHIARHSIDVVVYCDRTEYRHDSKRDSTRRYAEVAIKKAKLVQSRFRLMQMHEQVKKPPSSVDIATMEAALLTVGEEVEGLEHSIVRSPLDDLYRDLVRVASIRMLSPESGDLSVKEAVFQADAAIAVEAVRGTIDLIVSKDSDFAVLAGPKGLMMNDFTFSRASSNRRPSKLHGVKLSCGHWDTIQEVLNMLHMQADSENVIKAEYPILDGQELRVRAMIAVAIGCDANPGGVRGIGPAAVSTFLSAHDCKGDLLFSSLCSWMSNAKNCTHSEKELEVFAETILFEPGNCVENGDVNCFCYLEQPENVSRYHAEFVSNVSLIRSAENDVDICICKGVQATKRHKFLRSEGVHACKECSAELCRFCHITDSSCGKEIFCLPCFSGLLAGSSETNDIGKNIAEMRAELVQANIPEAKKMASPVEVVELYEEVVVKKKTAVWEDAVSNISVPECSSNHINNISTIVSFRFSDGGSIMRNDRLSDKDRSELVQLLATFVDYSGQLGSKHRDAKGASQATYRAMPDIFITLAEGSRKGSGYRLLERALRHAMDEDAPSLFETDCLLARTPDGRLCLQINGKVRKSYDRKTTSADGKQLSNLYSTITVITGATIYACRCNCKVGCNNTDTHVCVHNFGKLAQLPIGLFDGLAEHILIELSAQWGGREPDLSTDEKKELKKALHILKSCSCTKMDHYSKEDSICDILNGYTVSTERAKLRPRIPKVTELGPISTLGKVMKPSTAAKRKLDELWKEGLVNQPVANSNTDMQAEQRMVERNISSNLSNGVARGCRSTRARNNKHNASFDEGTDYIGVVMMREFFSQLCFATSSGESHMLDTVGHRLVDFRLDKLQTHARVLKNAKKQLCLELQRSIQLLSARKEFTNGSSRRRIASAPLAMDANESAILANPSGSGNNMTTNITFCRGAGAEVHEGGDADQLGINEGCTDRNMGGTTLACNTRDCTNAVEGTFMCGATKNGIETLIDAAAAVAVGHPAGSLSVLAPSTTLTDRARVGPAPPAGMPGAQGENNIRLPGQSKRKQQWSRKCIVPGCGKTNLSCGAGSWHSVPAPDKRTPMAGMRARTLRSIASRRFVRNESLRRLGLKQNSDKKYWICPRHQYETIRTSIPVTMFERRLVSERSKGKKYVYKRVQCTMTVSAQVPLNSGFKSFWVQSTEQVSRGTGASRSLLRKISEIESESPDKGISIGFNQLAEVCANESIPLSVINDSVALATGIDNGRQAKVVPSSPRKKMRIIGSDSHASSRQQRRVHYKEGPVWKRDPAVNIDIPAKEVVRRTGFCDIAHMLGFVSVVCNGDVVTLIQRASCLTWLEEWFMYFEFIWGRTTSRIQDSESAFKCSKTIVRSVIMDKQAKVLLARESWPMYCSMEEDAKLRASKWEESYGNMRCIMHDATALRVPKYESAHMNRIMYNAYYGDTVAKGGVWLQFCGWLGVTDLWTGAIGDTAFLEGCGALEKQKQFAENDTEPGGEVVPFTNITDKGYRCVLAAWKKGQFLLQPTFANSDQRFSSKDVLTSAAIASDRGGNERAVKVCKYSDLLKRGLQKNGDPTVFNNHWKSWSFQANFMFLPVL